MSWHRVVHYTNLGILALTLIFCFAIGMRTVKGSSQAYLQRGVKQASVLTEFKLLDPLPIRSLQEYQSLFASKRLFRPLIKSVTSVAQVTTLDDLAAEFNVIGIIKQDEPEAVVKNIRTQQTVFVRKGSSIGQLKVEAIEDEKVVVSYAGETKSLFIQ